MPVSGLACVYTEGVKTRKCASIREYVSVCKVPENTWVCVPFYGMRIYARLIWPLAFPRVETAHKRALLALTRPLGAYLHSLILYVFRDTASHVLCPHKKKFFYIFFVSGLARPVNGLYTFSGFRGFCRARPGSMRNSPIGRRTRTRPS